MNEEENNVIFAFSKKIKEEKVEYSTILDEGDIEKIESVISKLPPPKEKRLDEIGLRTNPKKWIISLLNNYPNIDKEDMEELLNDFTDSMRTRMREESKYALGIIMKDQILLCHSIYGEETITPEWKTIPRMLDSDNVLRYIRFIRTKEKDIVVKYFERYATESFVEWLRLPQKEAFYHFGGYYRIYSEVDGIVSVFELNEDEIEKWIKSHPEFSDGKIKFSTPVEYLTVKQIKVGRKIYDNTKDFLQDYSAEKYQISYHQREYKKIVSSMQPFTYKFYDEKSRLVKIQDSEAVSVVEKRNPNLDILFLNEHIDLRESYLEDIYKRFVNGEKINIFHAGVSYAYSPLKIGSMSILNDIKLSYLTELLLKYYSNVNLQDRDLKRFIEIVIFDLLTHDAETSPLNHFLKKFKQKLCKELSFGERLTKLEDGIIELKSRDYFVGKDREIIEKLIDVISQRPFVICMIGVEDNGALAPIKANRLKSDRIEKIKQALEIEVNKSIYAIPVFHEDNGILILVAGRENNDKSIK